MSEIVIYTNEDNQAQVEVTYEKDTFWLNLNQISQLFERDKSVISRHIKNIFNEGELDEFSTVAKNATVQTEGERKVTRKIDYYNLNVILAVGYRVSSIKGTQFRIWATNKLNEYLMKGYVINKKRLEQTNKEVKFLRSGIKIMSRAIEKKANEKGFQWLEQFAIGLELLDDYDHENLDTKGRTESNPVYPTNEEYQALINEMKYEFKSPVFGKKMNPGFDSAINQIANSFGDSDYYPSLEEKAAMLLYLIIKNHAFTDGNKRIAAACFLMFLEYNKLLTDEEGIPVISNEALASLTLFVASSKPDEIETVKNLIISILNRNR